MNEDDPVSSFGLPRTRRGRRIFFAIQWSAVIIVLASVAIAVSPRGIDEVFRIVVLPACVMLLFILAVLLIFPSLYLPARIRERALRKALPGSFVGTVLLNSTSKLSIATLRGGAPPPRPLKMTVGLSADEHGVTLWDAVWSPEQLASIVWTQVDHVVVTSYVFSGRVLGALSLSGTLADETMTLTLVQRRWFGMSPSRPQELEVVARRLRSLLAAAHDRPCGSVRLNRPTC